MDKKYWIYIPLIVLFIFVIFPAIFNYFMLISPPLAPLLAPKGVSNDNVWIGFGSSYFGGIIGGIIGGLFTFFGVRLTLRKEAIDKFIESYHRKIITLYEVRESLIYFEEGFDDRGNYAEWSRMYHHVIKIREAYQTLAEKIGGNVCINIYRHYVAFNRINDIRVQVEELHQKNPDQLEKELSAILFKFQSIGKAILVILDDYTKELEERYNSLAKEKFIVG